MLVPYPFDARRPLRIAHFDRAASARLDVLDVGGAVGGVVGVVGNDDRFALDGTRIGRAARDKRKACALRPDHRDLTREQRYPRVYYNLRRGFAACRVGGGAGLRTRLLDFQTAVLFNLDGAAGADGDDFPAVGVGVFHRVPGLG